MVERWEDSLRPELIGVQSTIYYHVGSRRWTMMKHPWSSLCCTAFGAMPKEWPEPEKMGLDIFLWKEGGVQYRWHRDVIGIKHGKGLCGGIGHSELITKGIEDPNMQFLSRYVDPVSEKFYRGFYEKMGPDTYKTRWERLAL